MFSVKIKTHKGYYKCGINKIKECVLRCLEPNPIDSRELQDRLIQRMSSNEVLGEQFKHVWVEKANYPRECYFLLLLVYQLTDQQDQGEHIIISAKRKQVVNSLFEECLSTISGAIDPKKRKRVKELKLPKKLRTLVSGRLKQAPAILARNQFHKKIEEQCHSSSN